MSSARRAGQAGARRAAALTLVAGAALASLMSGSAAASLDGVTATQVLNINPGGASSNPDGLTNVDGTLFFAAIDGSRGIELWKSDGTAAGTDIVEDIRLGALGSFPNNLIDVNGTLLFAAADQANGMELWKSVPPYDAGSTSIVENIRPGDQCSCPFNFANVNGTAFFAASDGTNGEELWKSAPPYDSASTTMVEDINAGADENPPNPDSSNPSKLTNVNGTLLFAAIDGATGVHTDANEGELWKSEPPDFNAASTSLVEDIRPGATGSIPFGFTAVGGTLYFNATDDTNGAELWMSASPFDLANTDMVEDIRMGSNGSFPGELTDVNGTLLFGADDGSGPGLWKSTDGSMAGTERVEDLNPGGGPPLAELTDLNGTLYFTADDGTNNGVELWRSASPYDAGATSLVADLFPGPGNSSAPAGLTASGDNLFFSADSGLLGREFYGTDGTTTRGIFNISPGGSSNPAKLTDVNGTLFFTADDGSTGVELWKTTIGSPGATTPQGLVPGVPPTSPTTKKKCKKRKRAAASRKRKCRKRK